MKDVFETAKFFEPAVYTLVDVPPTAYPRNAIAHWAPAWVLRVATGAAMGVGLWFTPADAAPLGRSIPITPAAITASSRTIQAPDDGGDDESPWDLGLDYRRDSPDHLSAHDKAFVARGFVRKNRW